MGLLFVLEGDEEAKEQSYDLSAEDHSILLGAAKQNSNNEFPLIRRNNRYYGDILFEADEIPSLIKELDKLNISEELEFIHKIISLCKMAIKKNRGIETIAD